MRKADSRLLCGRVLPLALAALLPSSLAAAATITVTGTGDTIAVDGVVT